MTALGYEFYLLVLNVYFQHSKIKFVSPRGHVISSLSLSLCIYIYIYICIYVFSIYVSRFPYAVT